MGIVEWLHLVACATIVVSALGVEAQYVRARTPHSVALRIGLGLMIIGASAQVAAAIEGHLVCDDVTVLVLRVGVALAAGAVWLGGTTADARDNGLGTHGGAHGW